MNDNQPTIQSAPGELSGLKPGQIFENDYRIIGIIGRGGVSTVYKAERIDNKQLVAVKVLHASRSKDQELVQRFIRECQTTARLEHPHAIKIYQWGIDSLERPFMIIEFLSGQTLAKRIRRSNGLNYSKAVEIMEQISSAIAEAHGLGIIHRDLKPENIILTTQAGLEDWVKVVDFGIARLEQEDPLASGQSNLTREGALLGTPLYMSPEQLRGRKADARSDIYSLGVIMYEMLTGQPPFASRNLAEIVVGHLNNAAPSPTQIRMDLNIPESLSQAILQALSKNPWERPTTVQEFCHSLTRSIRQPEPAPPKTSPAALPIKKTSINAPVPAGMVDPVKRVCPRCQTVAAGNNFRYCLQCGQDNTGCWLPYREQNSQVPAMSVMRKLCLLTVFMTLGAVLIFAANSHLVDRRILADKLEFLQQNLSQIFLHQAHSP